MILTLSSEEKRHIQHVHLKVQPQSGSPDLTFGRNGTFRFDFGTARRPDFAQSAAIDQAGRILLGGQKDGRMAVSRLTATGERDRSFGQQGFALSPVAGRAMRLVLGKSGQITAVGVTLLQGNDTASDDIVLARFNADGVLDSSYGRSGVATYSGGETYSHSVLNAVAQADGAVLAAGVATFESPDDPSARKLQPYVLLIAPDGSADRSFGQGGRVLGGPDQRGYARGLALGPADTIYVTGIAYSHDKISRNDGPAREYLARYLNDGSPDPTFGRKGFVTYGLDTTDEDAEGGYDYSGVYARDLTVLADGRILTVSDLSLSTDQEDAPDPIRIVRYRPDGSRDPEFGDDGEVLLQFDEDASVDRILPMHDGYLLVGSYSEIGSLESTPALYKIRKDGSLDPTFNFDGRMTTGDLVTMGAFLLPNGQILNVAGLDPDSAASEPPDRPTVEFMRIHP